MSEDLVICRCKEVTEEVIRKAIIEGADNLDAVKRKTKAGMGLCQGKTCSKIISNIINEISGKPLDQIVPFTTRPPLRPIPARFLVSKNSVE